MKRGRLLLVALLVLAGLTAVWRIRDSESGGDVPSVKSADPGVNPGTPESSPGKETTVAEVEPAPPEAVAPDPRPAPAPLPAPNPPSPQRQSPAAPPLPASQRPALPEPEPARVAVEAIVLNLREYRDRFGENPVGTNAEIVREMDGGNAKGATLIGAGVKRLNKEGELVDEWGTPYFFHQESSEVMEVRSAGADRVMWTSDDVVAR